MNWSTKIRRNFSKVTTPHVVKELPSLQRFKEQKRRLQDLGLATQGTFAHFEDDLPNGLFILVPARPSPLDWNVLMPLIELIKGLQGESSLDPTCPTDGESEWPTYPTLLEGVNGGDELRNVSQWESRKQIEAAGNTGFHTWHGFTLVALYPGILKEVQYLEMAGSCYGTKDLTTVFYTFANIPRLDSGAARNKRWFAGKPWFKRERT